MRDDHGTAAELEALQAGLVALADVRREDVGAGITAIHFTPRNNEALPFSLLQLGDSEVILETGSHSGGRWELELTPDDVGVLRRLVESIVAGRVVETIGPRGRSSVCVTFADGSTSTSTSMGVLWPPALGWRRRGRRIRYAPFART